MPVELPIFHLGTYRSQSGVPVTFTPELLRQLERNTNLVIREKALQPPVGYDHPAARDTNAHGRIASVRVEGGKLIATLDGTSEKLRDDAKNFRRLTYSPEFHEDFEFVNNGQTVKVGPTVIGLAMLGSQRGAIKNTAMVPLSEVPFGEGVDQVEALALRSELRSLGYLGEYDVDGKFFAEVENDERRFSERGNSEDDMDEKEFKRLLEENDKKWEDRFTKFEKQTEERVKSFSEEGKRVAAIDEKVRKVEKEKPIGQIALDRYRAALLNPTEETVQAFCESLPAFIVHKDKAGEKKKAAGGDADDEEDIDEPKNLAKVRVSHFSDRSKNEALLAAALDDLERVKPKMFSEAKATTVDARLAVLKQYVVEREAEAN